MKSYYIILECGTIFSFESSLFSLHTTPQIPHELIKKIYKNIHIEDKIKLISMHVSESTEIK